MFLKIIITVYEKCLVLCLDYIRVPIVVDSFSHSQFIHPSICLFTYENKHLLKACPSSYESDKDFALSELPFSLGEINDKGI